MRKNSRGAIQDRDDIKTNTHQEHNKHGFQFVDQLKGIKNTIRSFL